MREKIILLSLGTFVSLLVFLLSQFINSYVTHAEYGEMKGDLKVIKKTQTNIERDVNDIKTDINTIQRALIKRGD